MYKFNMLHFLALQNLPKTYHCYLSFFIVVMGIRCDCGSVFCRSYDVLSLYFVVVMMFMCIMVVIVVLVLLIL